MQACWMPGRALPQTGTSLACLPPNFTCHSGTWKLPPVSYRSRSVGIVCSLWAWQRHKQCCTIMSLLKWGAGGHLILHMCRPGCCICGCTVYPGCCRGAAMMDSDRWKRPSRSSRLRGDDLDRRIVSIDPERILREQRAQRRLESQLQVPGLPHARLGQCVGILASSRLLMLNRCRLISLPKQRSCAFDCKWPQASRGQAKSCALFAGEEGAGSSSPAAQQPENRA